MKLDSSPQWTRLFTGMLRQNDPTIWGNWILDPSIRPGAVGIVDPASGAFTPLNVSLPQGQVQFLKGAQSWLVESSGIERSESSVDFKGGYKDPSTGVTVTVGTKASWSFSHENSVSSNGRVTGIGVLDDFAVAMQNQFNWLLAQAKAANYATPDGIQQGFGVVTRVWDCNGAINIGSQQDKSTFDIVGSVDGVAAMTGEGAVDASIKGSYKNTDASTSFESHTFPSEPDQAAAGETALSFNFASFDGKVLIPRWAGLLTGLSLVFNNKPGCTYISQCSVDYDVPDGNGGHTHQHSEVSMSGGITRTIDGLPLGAYNLDVKIHLEAGDTYHFHWDSPIATWINGQVTFEIRGVWPWGGHVSWST